MAAKSERIYGRIWTLKITGVATSVKLHQVALDISSYAKSIIGIFRQADFLTFSLNNIIFIQLTNELEFRRLQQTNMLLINGETAGIEPIEMVFDSVPHPNTIPSLDAAHRNGAPLSVHVFGVDNL
ncbi:hypothetical protein PVAND_010534 [Polypedilum vanderplanki]|uniref:Uncharacterized protein n=1 Tax=Polypedilum vanderplanki TaxID=319348 RepID=A0A9J6CG89_POLVA|nr:hypothetical protein PVAND_010534 [Polypedilum vanderplanki]